jgi:hypothetical protein
MVGAINHGGGVDSGATDVGRSPSGRATHERSQSVLSPPTVGIPNADVSAHLSAVAEDRLWDDQICTLVDWGFGTVSRNPSDWESSVAYRRAIASVLHHMRAGWQWEYASFMGRKGWMWRRHASAIEAREGGDVKHAPSRSDESAVAKPDALTLLSKSLCTLQALVSNMEESGEGVERVSEAIDEVLFDRLQIQLSDTTIRTLAQAAIAAVLGTFDLEAIKTLVGEIDDVLGGTE